jgi:ATP-dependent DNA ligase
MSDLFLPHLFLPQLAENMPNIANLDQYIHDPQWAFEQKIDGHRVLMHVIDGQPVPVNRKGEVKKVPQLIFDAFHTEAFMGHWAFDGELIDKEFVVFDVPLVPKLITPNDRYSERRKVLDQLFGMWSAPAVIKLPWALSVEEKTTLMHAVKNMSGEGLMLKKLDSVYYTGRKSFTNLKCKFRADIDCVVMELGRGGKANMVLGVYRDGELVEVGDCGALTGDGPRVKVGDVVCVTYLYATTDNRLFQPTMPKIRTDKLPTECTFDQLKYTSRTVLA